MDRSTKLPLAQAWEAAAREPTGLRKQIADLEMLLRNNQVRREEVEGRHGDLLRENEGLRAALSAVVRGWELGLSAGDLHDIAKEALVRPKCR